MQLLFDVTVLRSTSSKLMAPGAIECRMANLHTFSDNQGRVSKHMLLKYIEQLGYEAGKLRWLEALAHSRDTSRVTVRACVCLSAWC